MWREKLCPNKNEKGAALLVQTCEKNEGRENEETDMRRESERSHRQHD